MSLRPIPDFPRPGILFQDITPLMADGPLFHQTVEELAALLRPLYPSHVVGIEARGLVFGGAVASREGIGFVPARKPGKLPGDTGRVDYALEYGTDSLEIHRGSFPIGARVVVIDDVLATGGTAAATARLIEDMEGEVVGLGFVVELGGLGGRERLGARRWHALTSVPVSH